MKADLDLTPTASQTVGPFFHLGCTQDRSVDSLVSSSTKGERIHITCRVFDGQGLPVDDAMIELWQANAEGKYNHAEDTQDKNLDPKFRGFGRLATDENGACTFVTIRPGAVAGDGNAVQAAHINISVFARGILKRLATRIYFAEDPVLGTDPVLSLVPEERRATLVARREAGAAGRWTFDIHLCGDRETVFFDV